MLHLPNTRACTAARAPQRTELICALSLAQLARQLVRIREELPAIAIDAAEDLGEARIVGGGSRHVANENVRDTRGIPP